VGSPTLVEFIVHACIFDILDEEPEENLWFLFLGRRQEISETRTYAPNPV